MKNDNFKKGDLFCSICGHKIIPNSIGWKYGNNAFPINEGRCCDDCKYDIVLPRRIVEMNRRKEMTIKNEDKNK